MKLFDTLERSARVFPEKLAATYLERSVTYRELYGSSLKMRQYLESRGFSRGGRAAILVENSPEYLTAFFAVTGAGLVVVPVDTSLNPEKINFILNDCGAECLIIQSKYERHLEKILAGNTALKELISDRGFRGYSGTLSHRTMAEILQGTELSAEMDNSWQGKVRYLEYNLEKETSEAPTELAAIFYTSGSTGQPKGVMLSHRNLISNTIATVEYLKLTPDDSVIVILPFYYIYGNSLLLTHILCGGRLVIDNRFLYPEVVLDTMEQERVTGFSGVPSNFMILLNNSTFATRKLEALRYFTQAGGAMAPEVVRRLMATFPHKEIYIMYGQTEAAPRVSYCPPDRLKDKVGSIGIPVPGVRIRIVNDDGVEVPTGEEGEIAVFGDNVMLGYWNQPEEQSQVLRNGWLHTGDLARKDEEGYFYIVGRKKEIIKAGGNRVSAKEVEECILENEKIAEATVFGVKDDILGEAIKAVIVLKEGATADKKEIQVYCRAKLADYKIPKYVDFVEALPKYKSGKVNKLQLINQSGR